MAIKHTAGDYDGDGKTDLAVWRPSEGNWYVILSSTGAPQAQPQWGARGDIPVPGDYDGDGRTDLAVWRPSEGNWYVIPSSTGTPHPQSQWGAPGDVPVPGDYDGDGKTDLAVWRPSEAKWYVIPSSTGIPQTRQWGAPGDIPVPGDYDGDGKTDFAVWRPSEGNWYVIPSSTGNPQATRQWGTPGDIPVPGDYDGDGKTDFAVWRPSEGKWYVIPSSTGTPHAARQWGIVGDVPVITTRVRPNMPSGPAATGDSMKPGEVLNPDRPISSTDGLFFFIYQADGNLVLYNNRSGTSLWVSNANPLWASNTAGKPAGACIMQSDGNLVIYDSDVNPVWASNTAGNPGSRLAVQVDGNVVIYRPNGSPAWASNTVQNFSSPTVAYTDAHGYNYVETSDSWKSMCKDLPCFDALQWPDYASTHFDYNIDGQPVVIQLWKGWCQKFLGMNNFPGGVGGEVGVYRRMPGRARPTSLPFLPPPLANFILKMLSTLADEDVWWPFPELNVSLEFKLVNPVNQQTFFSSGPEKSYWLAKWMNEDSYSKYQHDQGGLGRTPFFSVGYSMDYRIKGQSYPRW